MTNFHAKCDTSGLTMSKLRPESVDWVVHFVFEKMKKMIFVGPGKTFFLQIWGRRPQFHFWDLFIGQGLRPWLGLDLQISIHPNLTPCEAECENLPIPLKPTFLPPGESHFWFLNFWIKLNEKIPPKKIQRTKIMGARETHDTPAGPCLKEERKNCPVDGH